MADGEVRIDPKRLYFGSVQIIESLPAGEMRTGWNLHGELEPICLMSKPQVVCSYARVANKAEFASLLAKIRDEVVTTGRRPILHFETHGSRDGITLASEEFVPWAEFRPMLTAINEVTELGLFVLLSACDGADLVQVVQPTERAAVLALIGPKRPMLPAELERGMTTFYRTLFSAMDAPTAWKAMNAVIDKDKTTFAVFKADFNFRYIIHHFLTKHCSEEGLAARESNWEAEAIKSGKPRGLIELERPLFRAKQRDFQYHFDLTKRHYFFIDRFPGNASRYPVTLDDCWRSPSAG